MYLVYFNKTFNDYTRIRPFSAANDKDDEEMWVLAMGIERETITATVCSDLRYSVKYVLYCFFFFLS